MVKYHLPRGKWFSKVARKTCHDDLCRSSTFVSHNIKASLRRIFDWKQLLISFYCTHKKRGKKKERKKFIHNRKKEKQRYSYNIYIGILLRFSKTRELWSSKAAFTSTFFAAVNHNYDHKLRTLKHRKTQNRSKSTNYQSQTMTFWTRWGKLLFPKRSAKIIDGREKRTRHLAFELQNSRVYEKRSRLLVLTLAYCHYKAQEIAADHE